MKGTKEEFNKITIKYTDDVQCWNKFANFLISFMVESNILEGYYEKNKSTIDR